MTKAELRRTLQNRLLAMPPERRRDKSKQACRNLIGTPEFESASVVMIYLSLPHEVDTADAILNAWQLGKIVAVPKISWQQRHMIPVRINSLETGISAGPCGLRNPVVGVPVPFDEIDLVVAPALGLDRKGNRLGRGGSYYDRFFASRELRASRCGFVFAEQMLDCVPVSETDQPVEFIVTDEEVIYLDAIRGAKDGSQSVGPRPPAARPKP